jgi:hypothetical protein
MLRPSLFLGQGRHPVGLAFQAGRRAHGSGPHLPTGLSAGVRRRFGRAGLSEPAAGRTAQ